MGLLLEQRETTLTLLENPETETEEVTSTQVDCVLRTACCGSEGGKKIAGSCFICHVQNPEMVWMAVTATKCATLMEPHEMREPTATGGYVPNSVRNGAPQYASTGKGGGLNTGSSGSSVRDA